MPDLREVIISITNRCNSRCKMCDIHGQKTEELSIPAWKGVISDALALQAKTIVFSGGEPLLREDIFELISFVKNNHMKACITSNGYFLNEDMTRRLAEVSVDVVNISVEGPKDIHDYLRGDNSFDRAIVALESLKKYKIESTIATVISNYNYRSLIYIVELARQYGVTTIKFQPFSAIFLSRPREAKGFLIHPSDKEELGLEINKAAKLCNDYGITTNPLNYLERIPVYATQKKNKIHEACLAFLTSCPIDCAGEVYLCWALTNKDNVIGNIKENRLLNIWGSDRRTSFIEKIKRSGCPGCMMSCYDENFGKESVKIRIAANMNRLRKEGLYCYSNRLLKKWIKRIKFYIAYRGSPKNFIFRLKKMFLKKNLPKVLVNQKEVGKALEEIRAVKSIFEKEIKNSI